MDVIIFTVFIAVIFFIAVGAVGIIACPVGIIIVDDSSTAVAAMIFLIKSGTAKHRIIIAVIVVVQESVFAAFAFEGLAVVTLFAE